MLAFIHFRGVVKIEDFVKIHWGKTIHKTEIDRSINATENSIFIGIYLVIFVIDSNFTKYNKNIR